MYTFFSFDMMCPVYANPTANHLSVKIVITENPLLNPKWQTWKSCMSLGKFRNSLLGHIESCSLVIMLLLLRVCVFSETLGHENPVFRGGSPETKTRTVSQIMTRQSSETGRHLLSEPGTPLSPPAHGDVFFPAEGRTPTSQLVLIQYSCWDWAADIRDLPLVNIKAQKGSASHLTFRGHLHGLVCYICCYDILIVVNECKSLCSHLFHTQKKKHLKKQKWKSTGICV